MGQFKWREEVPFARQELNLQANKFNRYRDKIPEKNE